MNVYIFGNKDLAYDSLPIKILPEIKKTFPKINFEIKDPNEELDTSSSFLILDTVMGIDKVIVFTRLKEFSSSPNLTLHDFDVFSNLKLLEKIGKLPKIKIIGIPPTISEKNALKEVTSMLKANLP
jgi:Ni,Fe-hydrogenase maturation factor